MRSWRIGWGQWVAGCVVVAMLMVGVAARAGHVGILQRTTTPAPGSQAPPSIYSAAPPNTADPAHSRMQEQQLNSAANDRHKRMTTDADKLLQLATELKEEVDKTTKNEMSVTTIKKAAEIEKLAHDVKERMKGE